MRIGGTLEQSLSQGYRLDLQGVLKEGWQQTRRTGFGLALAIAGVMAIWILLSNTLLTPYVAREGGDMDMALILSLLATVIMSPMTSSLDMLGLQQSVGVRARPSQVFDFFRHFLRLGSLSLLGSLITSLFGPLFELLGVPVMLAFIPSALVGMGLVFTVPLVLERGLSPAQAILVSLKLFARGWPSIVLLHGVMLALFFLALIPMGLGLIWVAPLYFNCKGILYRDLCGVAVEVTEVASGNDGQGPDHFNA
ncbi:hypothetical protein ACEUCS_05620 [Aeromonas caviae]|jgi:hypothetical protein|uniref:Uncharacterized protein n=1 Tax=Aeromonas caviae TaxID=648 RepID=A0AAV4YMZ1_AERCA|nr:MULTISPECIES: hypothetical protein [Aeromonas]MBP6791087.1 hypothetical protein [Aeromonas sp.]MBA8781825.1 hypothetical protein [Aeromonas caviae]MBA8785881.1 hypothetical protein [Aeromonas sp. TW 6]MBP4060944.1 hypothetical protein [Aeromonas sp. Prich7-2]MBP8268002.1 hypothetical protein [Aeromonas sp.]